MRNAMRVVRVGGGALPCGAWMCGALLWGTVGAAVAAPIAVMGQRTGAAAQPGLYFENNDQQYHAYAGNPGYAAAGGVGNSYLFANTTLTGGAGGDAQGTSANQGYEAGPGGAGATIIGGGKSSATAIISSGTFTGGRGGTTSGVGTRLASGSGGYGLFLNDTSVTVNGGTFVGGEPGQITGSGVFGVEGRNPGSVYAVSSRMRLNGGAFPGGLYTLSSDVDIRGGTLSAITVTGGTLTLYGTSFTVNGTPILNSGTVAADVGTVSGQLELGGGALTSFSFDARRLYSATFNVVLTPEPATLTAFAAMGLALGRRRRASETSGRL